MSQGVLRTVHIGIKGAGEMASAIAWRLWMANVKCIFMMELPHPLAVRRGVSFCEAVHDGHKTIEGITLCGLMPHRISRGSGKRGTSPCWSIPVGRA